MNKFKMLLTILLLIILPNTIYADCTDEEINHYKKIKDDYKIVYEYNKETKDYTITFYRPEPDKYEYIIYADEENFANYEDISEKETIYRNVPGDNYYIEILGMTNTCNDVLKELTLNLKRTNNYADDPLCEGIEEFVLCQPTYDKEIDYETFASRVNTYKKTKQNKTIDEPKQEEEDNKLLDTITDFIKNNLVKVIIICVFIIAVVITIILTAKSIRKSRRLE